MIGAKSLFGHTVGMLMLIYAQVSLLFLDLFTRWTETWRIIKLNSWGRHFTPHVSLYSVILSGKPDELLEG